MNYLINKIKKNNYKTDIEIVKATMLNSWNPMFMPWSVDFFNERLFDTPFRNKKPLESRKDYASQFIDYLSDFLNKKGGNRLENETILAIYTRNFLTEKN